MFTVLVTMQIHPERLADFRAGIAANAHATRTTEPGCLRFDVHQLVDDPHRFVLYEIYTDPDAFYVAHRNAPHYPAWRLILDTCVVPGSHHNTFAAPTFPDDILESRLP
ncbi:putative quinol monooxygenase [Nakamurella deserti]|uniref:putative quinol monooxygenase n=1 Tax=Nakamurella deserti TaxID=2164074 RepID=UPI000DBE83FD|nr:putative quinol monooxygenase [Nakamurella deserti]